QPRRAGRGEVPSGAVTADRHVRRIDAHRRAVLEHPASRGDGVVDAGWKAMLGREPVVDGDDDGPRLTGKRAAGTVMRIDRSENEATSVKPDEGGREGVGTRGGRGVHARGAGAESAGHRAIDDVDVVNAGQVEQASRVIKQPPAALDPALVKLGLAADAHQPEQRLALEIELEP